jgi:hypothetical protein
MIKKQSPGTGGTVRGAKGEGNLSNLTLHQPASSAQAATFRRQKRSKTFAEWAQTPAPHQLGLEPDTVARIARAMAQPEMRGISSGDALLKSLMWLRLFYEDELAWQRFMLAARYLWLAYKGKA